MKTREQILELADRLLAKELDQGLSVEETAWADMLDWVLDE